MDKISVMKDGGKYGQTCLLVKSGKENVSIYIIFIICMVTEYLRSVE